jgi:hypothetical protein
MTWKTRTRGSKSQIGKKFIVRSNKKLPRIISGRRPQLKLGEIYFTPVKNDEYHNVKPNGGFWTSTFKWGGPYASEWIDFVTTEMTSEDVSKKPIYLLTVKPTARLYTIDSYKDLKRLIEKYPFVVQARRFDSFTQTFPDWEAISKDYDGVHMTSKGQGETRLSRPYSLYGWDVESTLWFRNVFDKVIPFKGKVRR